MIQEAEIGLRRLMQEEIAAGRYTELSALASLADGVSAVLEKASNIGVGKPAERPVLPPREVQASKLDSWPGASRPSPSGKGSKKNVKYPCFEIVDGWIGKVGWSKKSREEYRHYAPVSAALSLAEHVDTTQAPSRVWTVEDVGAVVNGESGEVLPSYQLYLVIAWLRSINLLAKQGRSGYVAVGGDKLLPRVKRRLGGA